MRFSPASVAISGRCVTGKAGHGLSVTAGAGSFCPLARTVVIKHRSVCIATGFIGVGLSPRGDEHVRARLIRANGKLERINCVYAALRRLTGSP